MESLHSFIVDGPGVRLDKYVHENCPELSRTQAQRLITEGHITVNDRAARSSHKLDIGDRVKVFIPPPLSLLPEAIPLTIVYQDDDVLVIDKPAGLTVFPAPGHPSHTLANALLSLFPEMADGVPRMGIVHRLDKDTSGLLVVARNEAAQADLMSQFKARAVAKSYTALVRGHLEPECGIIEAPIGRDPRRRQRMAVVAEGKEARTRYDVIRYIENFTLLEIKPETGRTHQIRVHLTAIGFPVVGDKVYGVRSPHLFRQFLHASRLGFRHPSTGKYVEFNSDLPPDLEKALKDIA